MKSAFRGEQAKAVLSQWFDRFRDRLKVPTESRMVKTRFGDTHLPADDGGLPAVGPPSRASSPC